MDPALIPIAAQFGMVGVVALAAGAWVWFTQRTNDQKAKEQEERHLNERVEWRQVTADQHKELLTQAQRGSEALDNNTRVMARLETIITSSNHN